MLNSKPFRVIIFSLFLLLSAYYLITTALGIYINYSGVPFWDMWNGYLEFYYRSLTEGWAPWWELHNEHRLVLAKIFFWIDLQFFKGNLIFLFILNWFFSLLAFTTIAKVALNTTDKPMLSNSTVILLAALVSLCFSWVQSDNYTWAFQSQFHMAYLIPLLSFITLAKASNTQSNAWFLIALSLGFASIVTMANGLLALPLLLVFSIFLRFKLPKILLIAAVTLAAYYLYFRSYYTVPGHISITDSFKENLLISIQYFLRFLAGPFYPVTKRSLLLSTTVGAVFIGSTLVITFLIIKNRASNPVKYNSLAALLMFIVYVAGSGSSAALTRSIYGMDIPGRYMTPSLLSWACLLVLISILSQKTKLKIAAIVLNLGLILILLPLQKNSLKTHDLLVSHKLAAIALNLKINDTQSFDRVYFDTDKIKLIAELPRQDKKSFYSLSYVSMPSVDLTYLDFNSLNACNFYIDSLETLSNEETYYKVNGWIFDPTTETSPSSLMFVNQLEFKGYAISGLNRGDLSSINPRAVNGGFVGYMQIEAAKNTVHPTHILGFDQHDQPICSSVIEQPLVVDP